MSRSKFSFTTSRGSVYFHRSPLAWRFRVKLTRAPSPRPLSGKNRSDQTLKNRPEIFSKSNRVTMTELSAFPARRASIHVENFKNQIGKFVVRRRRSNSFFNRVNGRLATSTSSLVSQISLTLAGEATEVASVSNLDTVLR